VAAAMADPEDKFCSGDGQECCLSREQAGMLQTASPDWAGASPSCPVAPRLLGGLLGRSET